MLNLVVRNTVARISKTFRAADCWTICIQGEGNSCCTEKLLLYASRILASRITAFEESEPHNTVVQFHRNPTQKLEPGPLLFRTVNFRVESIAACYEALIVTSKLVAIVF